MRKVYKNVLIVAIFLMSSPIAAIAQATTFDFTGTWQTYTVPDDVYLIEIEATGAEGGKGLGAASGNPGKGARMQGKIEVTPGEVVHILVGGQGEAGDFVGGGGGSSMVWNNATSTVYVVAGGGGGGGSTVLDKRDGLDASITTDGVNGNGMTDGAGTAGSGATAPTAINYAGGGAGILTSGNSGTTHGCVQNCTGGNIYGTGGFGGGTGGTIADGGYSGGGGGNGRCGAVGGGGGGGYSGGGAGGEIVLNEYSGGGGGGSYNIGTDQDNLAGVGTGNGQVIINPICNPILVSYTTIDETIVENGAIDITVSGGGGSYSYDWDTDGTGDFDDSEDLIGIAGGTYIVTVQDESICDDAVEVIELNSLLNIENNHFVVGIFPNPTSDVISINQKGNFDYEIVNELGQLIATGSGIENKLVSLENLANGKYFVVVKIGTQSETIILMKE